MPAMMGKAKAQQRLIDNLEDEFAKALSLSLTKVQMEHHLLAGDFPNVEHFREVLAGYTIANFERLTPHMIQSAEMKSKLLKKHPMVHMLHYKVALQHPVSG